VEPVSGFEPLTVRLQGRCECHAQLPFPGEAGFLVVSLVLNAPEFRSVLARRLALGICAGRRRGKALLQALADDGSLAAVRRRRQGLAKTEDETDLSAAGKACLLVPAGAVDHVEEGLAVQVPPEVVGEQPPEGHGDIRVTAGRDVRCQQDLG